MVDKRVKILLIFLLLFHIVLFTNCSTVWKKKFKDDEAMMYGMVYDENDEALGEVEIHVDGKLKAVSDTQGRFILKYIYGDILEAKRHSIKLSRNGYETIEELIFYDPMSLLYFTMESGEALLSKAEALIDSGNYKDADKELNRLLKIEDKKDAALYLLAILRVKEGRQAEAVQILGEMENKNNPYVKKLLEKIK